MALQTHFDFRSPTRIVHGPDPALNWLIFSAKKSHS